jgi:hypothetical protein
MRRPNHRRAHVVESRRFSQSVPTADALGCNIQLQPAAAIAFRGLVAPGHFSRRYARPTDLLSLLQERTSAARWAKSEKCHHRKSVDLSITLSVHSSSTKHFGFVGKAGAVFVIV